MKIGTMLSAAIVTVFAAQPLWAGVEKANGYEWEFDTLPSDSESVQLIHLMHGPGLAAITPSPVGNVTIPDELDGKLVKFLGVNSFADCDKIRFLASGKVAVKGSFVTGKDARGKDIVYPVSGSTVLAGPSIQQDDGAVRMRAFIYFPPKPGKFAGYMSEWYLEWNGQEFERIE